MNNFFWRIWVLVLCLVVAAPAHSDPSGFSWGYNGNGQLGDGTYVNRVSPTAIFNSGALAGKTVTIVHASQDHSLAVTSEGRVYAWGGYGALLGNNTYNASAVPVAVHSSGVLAGKTIVAVSAGFQSSLALDSQGRVYAWGDNTYGQLGNGSRDERSLVPVAVDVSGALAGKTIVAIDSGTYHSIALDSEGRIYTWGYNVHGQLGNGQYTDRRSPVAIGLAGKKVSSISAGDNNCLVSTSDGMAYAWGDNQYGQVGDGTLANRKFPQPVKASGGLAGKIIIEVSTNHAQSVVLTADNALFAWGRSDGNSLGTGSFYSHNPEPAAVRMSGALTASKISQISAGGVHTLALTFDGKLYAWGGNGAGALGDGTTASRSASAAVKVSGVLAGKTVTSFSAGSSHSMAATGPAPADRTAPVVVIRTPANNSSIRDLTEISGLAGDGGGVSRIDLYLQRRSDGKFWNGETWAPTVAALSTSLGGTLWYCASALPSGTNLLAGEYLLGASAFDASGNTRSTTSKFKVMDAQPPQIDIASPTAGSALTTLPAISGTASDDTGVVRVDLYLQRRSDNKFWNGEIWGPSFALSTSLQGFAPRQWTRNSGLPSGANLANGLYFVAARAYDAVGNGTSATANFTIDTLAPTVAIASPAINSTVSSFASASGTTSDNGGSGVVRVEFFLRRNADGKWWNGSAWVATGFPLATSLAPISGGQKWGISSPLPQGANLVDGSYLIGATAFDRANNSRNANGNFTLRRTAAIASPVQLSSATAKADGTIRLTFTGTLGANASDAANYIVTSNEQAIEIANVSQPQASTVEFDCTTLQAGARVSIEYDIEDAQGRNISGTATVVVK